MIIFMSKKKLENLIETKVEEALQVEWRKSYNETQKINRDDVKIYTDEAVRDHFDIVREEISVKNLVKRINDSQLKVKS